MTPNVFLTSDQHYCHANCLTFEKKDGTLMRPGFSCIEEMNELLINNHNSLVKSKDKIYFCGDVALGNVTKFDSIMSRLNGEKILIRGNHDNLKLSNYTKWFKDIRSGHQLAGCLLTHIPVHPESLSRWKANVHGHLHHRRVMHNGEIDTRYFSVCVEIHEYKPIPLEVLVASI